MDVLPDLSMLGICGNRSFMGRRNQQLRTFQFFWHFFWYTVESVPTPRSEGLDSREGPVFQECRPDLTTLLGFLSHHPPLGPQLASACPQFTNSVHNGALGNGSNQRTLVHQHEQTTEQVNLPGWLHLPGRLMFLKIFDPQNRIPWFSSLSEDVVTRS